MALAAHELVSFVPLRLRFRRGAAEREALAGMNWIARLLGYVPKAERDGIRLEEIECWKVDPIGDGASYFRALRHLVRDGAVIYLEGTVDQEVRDFLTEREIESPVSIAVGTIWPAPDRHHLPATIENLDALARLLEERSVALPATHTHVHRAGRVVVEWYDAFVDDPIYVSGEVDEGAVSRFADALGSAYEWAPHAA